MEDPKSPKLKVTPLGFDVTHVIGTVKLGGGNLDPHVAAMHLIGEFTADGAGGEYRFPAEGGGEVVVTVEHTS